MPWHAFLIFQSPLPRLLITRLVVLILMAMAILHLMTQRSKHLRSLIRTNCYMSVRLVICTIALFRHGMIVIINGWYISLRTYMRSGSKRDDPVSVSRQAIWSIEAR